MSSHGLRCASKVCKEHSVGFPTDSHGVSFPLACHPDQDPLSPSLPYSVCSAFRFSQPLSGLLPWSAISLISCRIRLWDSTLQSFPLPKSWKLSQASIPSWCFRALAPTGYPGGLTGFQRVNTASVVTRWDKPSGLQTTGDAVPRSGRPSLRVHQHGRIATTELTSSSWSGLRVACTYPCRETVTRQTGDSLSRDLMRCTNRG